MPRPRRRIKRYCLYHIYNRGNRKQDIFKGKDDYDFFIYRLYELSSEYSLQIKGYCLMDNHYHLLIKIGSDPTELPKFMQRFLTSFCLYINKKYHYCGHVFQGRYCSSLVCTEGYRERIIQYFKDNPVKAGYARVWHQYRWIYLANDF